MAAEYKSSGLYESIVAISQDYLGPAAERFVHRQVGTHLSKEPAQLQQSDMMELISWIMLAFALLTNDAAIINEYSERLTKLAKHNKRISGRTSAAR